MPEERFEEAGTVKFAGGRHPVELLTHVSSTSLARSIGGENSFDDGKVADAGLESNATTKMEQVDKRRKRQGAPFGLNAEVILGPLPSDLIEPRLTGSDRKAWVS